VTFISNQQFSKEKVLIDETENFPLQGSLKNVDYTISHMTQEEKFANFLQLLRIQAEKQGSLKNLNREG